MALKQTCDGCGKIFGEGAVIYPRGEIRKRDYCDVCAGAADEYLRRRDRAIERAAEKYEEKMALALEGLPLAELPE